MVGLVYSREGYPNNDPSMVAHRVISGNPIRKRILTVTLRTVDKTGIDMSVNFIARKWIPFGNVKLLIGRLRCVANTRASDRRDGGLGFGEEGLW